MGLRTGQASSSIYGIWLKSILWAYSSSEKVLWHYENAIELNLHGDADLTILN
jgi:hypothetical protein